MGRKSKKQLEKERLEYEKTQKLYTVIDRFKQRNANKRSMEVVLTSLDEHYKEIETLKKQLLLLEDENKELMKTEAIDFEVFLDENNTDKKGTIILNFLVDYHYKFTNEQLKRIYHLYNDIFLKAINDKFKLFNYCLALREFCTDKERKRVIELTLNDKFYKYDQEGLKDFFLELLKREVFCCNDEIKEIIKYEIEKIDSVFLISEMVMEKVKWI